MNQNNTPMPELRTAVEHSIIRSARCLSELINNKVYIADLSVTNTPWDNYLQSFSDSGARKVVVLKTEIVGTIAGINYSVFTSEEVRLLCRQVLNQEPGMEESGEFIIGFLKEIENVLAAAVITEIADRSKAMIYGDVPKLQAIALHQVPELIRDEVNPILPKTHVSCTFQIPSLAISPRIFWFFNEALSAGISSSTSNMLVA